MVNGATHAYFVHGRIGILESHYLCVCSFEDAGMVWYLMIDSGGVIMVSIMR